MNLKIIKEYKKQLALYKLSGYLTPFIEWWKKLTPEQQFELKIIHDWHKKPK